MKVTFALGAVVRDFCHVSSMASAYPRISHPYPKPTTTTSLTLDGLNLKMLHLLQLTFADPVSEKEKLHWQVTIREVKISPETLLPPNYLHKYAG